MQPIATKQKPFSFFIAALFAQIILFLCLYVLKRHLFPAEIIFYEGVLLALLFFACNMLLWFLLRWRLLKCDSSRPQAALLQWPQATIAAFFFHYAFIITFPALLDRSISIFLIAQVAAAPQESSAENLEKQFSQIYMQGKGMRGAGMQGMGQIDKRLQEQISSGNMVEENGGVRITEQGKFLAAFNRLLAQLLNIDPRLVEPPAASPAPHLGGNQ